MGKLETSLTWLLITGILGYLFTTNFQRINSDYKNQNNLNWSKKIRTEDEPPIILNDCVIKLNIDSMLTVVIEELEDARK